jgi:hypothetical protein
MLFPFPIIIFLFFSKTNKKITEEQRENASSMVLLSYHHHFEIGSSVGTGIKKRGVCRDLFVFGLLVPKDLFVFCPSRQPPDSWGLLWIQ